MQGPQHSIDTCDTHRRNTTGRWRCLRTCGMDWPTIRLPFSPYTTRLALITRQFERSRHSVAKRRQLIPSPIPPSDCRKLRQPRRIRGQEPSANSRLGECNISLGCERGRSSSPTPDCQQTVDASREERIVVRFGVPQMGANGEPDRLSVEPTGGGGTPHSSGVFFARVLRNGPRPLTRTRSGLSPKRIHGMISTA